ncbi:MAG: DUF1846 domain-containing protein [Candidatus Bathyarchaeota archaeon]|nr:DUF1846 domain-containing protein [Candidatus Bathyarchaeota archaeon]MDH5713639.1 DUF1846 domain-containing protein [Candidatus Bathyarchaeota archaeon]
MIRKIGFDKKEYLNAQIKKILDHVSLFDKLYLEFGGKLCYDYHASRVLPGFDVDTKVQMLRRLGNKIEIIHCVSAKDIEGRKIRRDFGLAYDDQTLKDINDLREMGLDVSAVVINRFNKELIAKKFKQKLQNRGIRVFVHYEMPNYLKDLDFVISGKGYGKQEYVDTEKKIVVVTAPGPGSGKFSFCMAQIYNDRKQGVKSGFAKFETFPVWNLSLNHPVNIAYEAATADIGDYNIVDPFHKKAHGIMAINYSRDVENFAIMKRIIDKIVGRDDPMAKYRSPTDMGVNMVKKGIIDDEVVREASKEEIVRRYFRYHREFVEGDTLYDTFERMEKIIKKAGVKPEGRSVVLPAREAAEDARERRDEEKGYKGVFCGAAIEIFLDSGKTVIVTGKNSPLLYAESAALLNATKIVAKIPDEVDVISPKVIRSVIQLKNIIGLSSTSLDVKEILNALAASAVSDENARRCLDALDKLKGCEMHTTHLMNEGNEKALNQIGLNLTTDAKLPFLDEPFVPNYSV